MIRGLFPWVSDAVEVTGQVAALVRGNDAHGERSGAWGPAERLGGGSWEVEGAGLGIAGVLALAVVEGRAAGRVDPGDPGEVADAGVAGEGFGAPQGDQRRVGDELPVRA